MQPSQRSRKVSGSLIVSNGAPTVALCALLFIVSWRDALSAEIDSDGDGLSDAFEAGTLRYSVVKTNLTWLQAVEDAKTRGGHLATITSIEELDFVRAVVKSNGVSLSTVWLGGTDEEKEGLWRWITGEKWAFTNWYDREPNNGLGKDEDYLSMVSMVGGQWNDLAGTDKSAYILEQFFPTNPNNPDTDGDGILDGDEWKAGSFPLPANALDPTIWFTGVQRIHSSLVQISVRGRPGRFRVETSTDLKSWQPYASVLTDSGEVELFDEVKSIEQKFYRGLWFAK